MTTCSPRPLISPTAICQQHCGPDHEQNNVPSPIICRHSASKQKFYARCNMPACNKRLSIHTLKAHYKPMRLKRYFTWVHMDTSTNLIALCVTYSHVLYCMALTTTVTRNAVLLCTSRPASYYDDAFLFRGNEFAVQNVRLYRQTVVTRNTSCCQGYPSEGSRLVGTLESRPLHPWSSRRHAAGPPSLAIVTWDARRIKFPYHRCVELKKNHLLFF